MRIGMLIFALCAGKGGAERVAVNIATGLAGRGHECVLFYTAKEGSVPAYALPETIRAVNLTPFSPTDGWLEHARNLIVEENLDALLAFNSSSFGINYVILCRGLHIPLVWSEHSNPQIIETELWNRSKRLACMAAADAIVLLCNDFAASLPPFLRQRTVIIPNVIDLDTGAAPAPTRIGCKRILTVARLYESAKQISLLFHAVTLLTKEFSGWEWRICGDGPSKRFYKELISALGINGYVTLVGNVDDIAAEYAAADMFVLPSRYEGFPLALAEAQSFGLPAVGFAACTGVNEIIIHGKTGLLAPQMTAESLAEGMRTLMSDASLRQRMGEQARELSARYDAGRILDQWEKLFGEIVNRSGPVALDVTDTVEDPKIGGTLRSLFKSSLCIQSQPKVNIFKTLRAEMRQRLLLISSSTVASSGYLKEDFKKNTL